MTRLGSVLKLRSGPRSIPRDWPQLGGGGVSPFGSCVEPYRLAIPNMPSEPPDRVPSAPQDDNSSQGSKRRKASRRSPRTPHEPDNANDSSMGRRTLSTSSPQRGSSRDMTPPESAGSIKYTRTGRVSKATKGQRVHHCDDCGKVGLTIFYAAIVRLELSHHNAIMRRPIVLCRMLARDRILAVSLPSAIGKRCVVTGHTQALQSWH